MFEIGTRVVKTRDLCGDPVKKGDEGIIQSTLMIAAPDLYQYTVFWDGLQRETRVFGKYIDEISVGVL